jgi:hypothetical protein
MRNIYSKFKFILLFQGLILISPEIFARGAKLNHIDKDSSHLETLSSAKLRRLVPFKKIIIKSKDKIDPFKIKDFSRVVAIGDFHGDLDATKRVLRDTAKLIDKFDNWIGGKTILVQTGDILDRGPDEFEIIQLFENLKPKAEKAGGAIYLLHANHEIMNFSSDFRYVSEEGYLDFIHYYDKNISNIELPEDRRNPSHYPVFKRGRVAAFSLGGELARKMYYRNNVLMIIGDVVFLHGGIGSLLAQGGTANLNKYNIQVRNWLLKGGPTPKSVKTAHSLVWIRDFSRIKRPDCQQLDSVLKKLKGINYMVMGHTVQKGKGLNSACSNRAWRIDVGLSKSYGSKYSQALEITKNKEGKTLFKILGR